MDETIKVPNELEKERNRDLKIFNVVMVINILAIFFFFIILMLSIWGRSPQGVHWAIEENKQELKDYKKQMEDKPLEIEVLRTQMTQLKPGRK